MTALRRQLNPVARVLDEAKGLVEYVASDETLDSYREIIRASGWRFTNFKKNSPFVDSHDYSTIDRLLGKVVDFAVRGGRLIETVQWAKDVPENKLAQYGWAMVRAGFLPAVSVGFFPTKAVSRGDAAFAQQLAELGLGSDAGVRTIYTEQEQIELSAVIIGANPNALARAYKAGALDDAALDFLSHENAKRETARAAVGPDAAALARHQARERFLGELGKITQSL